MTPNRVRDLLVQQRTMLVNGLRGHLAEFGVVASRGIQKVKDWLYRKGLGCRPGAAKDRSPPRADLQRRYQASDF
jgi:transposase